MKRLAVVAAVLALFACRRDMVDRPERRPLGSSPFFADRSASRPAVPDTVPRDEPDTNRGPRPEARGLERYAIYCAPCHGRTGEGDGTIVRHGFPAPPSLFSAEVRSMTEADIVETITNGFGDMYSYADRVPESDRWAIAAYIKSLQGGRASLH